MTTREAGNQTIQKGSDELNDIVGETKEYYRRRARQYADWTHRTEEYEGGPPPEESWFADAKMLINALEASKPQGNVLEIACGTGIWTQALLRNANTVTALQSSQEMIER